MQGVDFGFEVLVPDVALQDISTELGLGMLQLEKICTCTRLRGPSCCSPSETKRAVKLQMVDTVEQIDNASSLNCRTLIATHGLNCHHSI